MAILEQGQRRLIAGIAIGMGVSWAARRLFHPFGEVLRPLAKAGLKSGLLAVEHGQEAVARLGETLDDLVAEIKAERAVEELAAAAAAEEMDIPASEA